MYSTRNTMMQNKNVLVDSCDIKVDFGALGSVSAEGSSFQTAVKLLSLYASYGGKQHVPLSLLKSHAQRAMKIIVKSYVDRAVVQSSCDEFNGETTNCLLAFMHIKQKQVANDFFMSIGASMASESVGVHASGYQSHSRHRHIQCEGLETIGGKRELDGRGKEINLRAYCVSTMCGVYGPVVRDQVECTDKNNDLVMHRDKDIDMFHLDWDFNIPVWSYGQLADIRMFMTVDHESKMFLCIHLYSNICCEDIALAYIDGRRKIVCSLLGGRGGVQLVAEEPSLSRRSPVLQSKMGVWSWASMALGVDRDREHTCVRKHDDGGEEGDKFDDTDGEWDEEEAGDGGEDDVYFDGTNRYPDEDEAGDGGEEDGTNENE
ncbi:hypothetical protein Syun_020994 [Stephania yunnanensis]|uniref:Uncharacterized protein n=1 Tax=Stephania yunnanensis TaxID=152371 RepID=A0AAP0IGT8_9MAGN